MIEPIRETEALLGEARGENLTRLVLESPPQALHAALGNPELEDGQLLLLLRRPDLPTLLLERLSAELPWSAKYLVKAALVSHPHTPRNIALNLVKHLFWRDLARVLLNFQVAPAVRRLAEIALAERIPEISVGEKITLARTAPREVVRALRGERDPRIVTSLLDNPRLTEEDVQMMINDRQTPAEALAAVARSERWVSRGTVRLALLARPQLPLPAAFTLLQPLAVRELQRVAENAGVRSGVRATARRLLAERKKALEPS